jgi:hypothetical protein
MKYNTNLFDSIKEALNKKTNTESSSFRDFMKLEIGKTYLVRLLPNIKNPERTTFHYYHHLWNSVITNQITSTLCPCTYGERCPIDEHRSKIYRSQDKAEIERNKPIKRNENWLINVYVIQDPTNPENNGQAKILRYGKQLDKIITAAISGDDAEDFGAKIFDLSENGCNLRIKVEENEGGYPTYVASRFLGSSALAGNPDTDELYDNVKDLESIFEHKSYEDIQKLFNQHWLGQSEPTPVTSSSVKEEDTEDFEVESFKPTPKPTSKPQPEPEDDDSSSSVNDRIQDILKDL